MERLQRFTRNMFFWLQKGLNHVLFSSDVTVMEHWDTKAYNVQRAVFTEHFIYLFIYFLTYRGEHVVQIRCPVRNVNDDRTSKMTGTAVCHKRLLRSCIIPYFEEFSILIGQKVWVKICLFLFVYWNICEKSLSGLRDKFSTTGKFSGQDILRPFYLEAISASKISCLCTVYAIL